MQYPQETPQDIYSIMNPFQSINHSKTFPGHLPLPATPPQNFQKTLATSPELAQGPLKTFRCPTNIYSKLHQAWSFLKVFQHIQINTTISKMSEDPDLMLSSLVRSVLVFPAVVFV